MLAVLVRHVGRSGTPRPTPRLRAGRNARCAGREAAGTRVLPEPTGVLAEVGRCVGRCWTVCWPKWDGVLAGMGGGLGARADQAGRAGRGPRAGWGAGMACRPRAGWAGQGCAGRQAGRTGRARRARRTGRADRAARADRAGQASQASQAGQAGRLLMPSTAPPPPAPSQPRVPQQPTRRTRTANEAYKNGQHGVRERPTRRVGGRWGVGRGRLGGGGRMDWIDTSCGVLGG
ncbi:hypothetical protein HNR67_003909 [Crossiella cryophila]|uniref:Uncharacterized protein n=1 Tax=Crossiella cryophila TaxID=43355 RepID=A0A7W7CD89_9PSEU|nr:hypothetical protein [Crossiella cryophila]